MTKYLHKILHAVEKGHAYSLLVFVLLSTIQIFSPLRELVVTKVHIPNQDNILLVCIVISFVISLPGAFKRILLYLRIFKIFIRIPQEQASFIVSNLVKFKRNKITRIVVMLPLNPEDNDYHLLHEVASSFIGIGHGLKALRKYKDGKKYEILSNVEIVLKDHKNKIDETKKIIKDELEIGTRHFICTMSKVCIPLTGGGATDEEKVNNLQYSFKNIIQECGNEKKIPKTEEANLLITTATSQHIKTEKGIYRLFPKANKEAEAILQFLRSNKVFEGNTPKKKHFVIFTTNGLPDHKYLEELHDSFIEKIHSSKGVNDEITSININHSDLDQISETINSHSDVLFSCKAVFVICKYDYNEKVIEALIQKFGRVAQGRVEVPYLITPSALPGLNYRFKDKSYPPIAEKIINSKFKNKWLFLVPMKCSNDGNGHRTMLRKGADEFYGELSEYFMNLSLRRIVEIVTKKNYTPDKFDELWRSAEIQNRIPEGIDLPGDINDPDVVLIRKTFK